MTANNFYKQMNWKPKLGSVYCIMDKQTAQLDLFYEVVELKVDKYINNELDIYGDDLNITFKVYDYRHTKNVNIYYVKLQPIFINHKHTKQDLVIYFQHGHGEVKLATHTITDAHRPTIYKTSQDTQAITTKLKKLLINQVYLCKYNNFNSDYGVEEFYTLYNILSKNHRLFGEIITPYDALYNKIVRGEYEYDFIDYTKQKFSEMCCFKNIYDKLKCPNQDDDEDYDNDSDEEEEEEVAEVPKVAETDEEINMF